MTLGPHAIFIIASYSIAVGGLVALALTSWHAARQASRIAAQLRGQSLP